MNRLILPILLASIGVLLGACQSTPRTGELPQDIPPIDEIVDRYNANVVGLDRFWARATARVEGLDAEGRPFSEQLEGHLQIERPERLALSLGKLGDTMFYFGSNERLAWWFDLWSDPKTGVAAPLGPEGELNADLFGLPIHPHDLVTLLGISPIALSEATTAVRTSEGILLDVPLRRGSASLTLDPQTYRPTRIALRDASASPVATAELTRPEYVEVVGDATIDPVVATSIDVRLAGGDARVRLSLFAPANREIRDMVFDPDRLAKIYRIDRWLTAAGATGG